MRRLTTLAALAFALVACSGTEPPAPPPPPVPPPPPPPTVTSIDLAPSSLTLEATKSGTFIATPLDQSGNPMTAAVAWTSDNPGVARVDDNGRVTAVAMGSTTIHATSVTASSVSRAASVTVTRQSFDHVFIVVLENRDYADVIGNAAMPYLNSLASRYALGRNVLANTHPSVGNYFVMTVGDTVTNYDNWAGVVDSDNVVRELVTAGKSWKSYAENIPSQGYTGPDQGLYTRHHNPMAYFSDVRTSQGQAQNLVPFSQLAADLASGSLPNYAFLVPNSCNDGHDCADDVVDNWLRANLDPIINNSAFANSMLIIAYDESRTDRSGGGGKIPFIIVSPRAKQGPVDTQFQLQSVLRLSLEAFGITRWPGRLGPGAPAMWEFFSR